MRKTDHFSNAVLDIHVYYYTLNRSLWVLYLSSWLHLLTGEDPIVLKLRLTMKLASGTHEPTVLQRTITPRMDISQGLSCKTVSLMKC